MKLKNHSIAVLLAGITIMPAHARPLFLEPSRTVGRLSFEAVASMQQRWDSFGSPQQKYETIHLPVTLRLGASNRLDIGATFDHVGHRLKTGSARYTGSDSGRISPEVKIGLRDNASFRAIWHVHTEEGSDALPVARGDGWEGRFLFTVPTSWPIHLDAGYLKRGSYTGRRGVAVVPKHVIAPGDIADAKLALEAPLPWGLSLTSEWIYSYVGHEIVSGQRIRGSSGKALDTGAALSWQKAGLTIGAGAMFGLLEESHTSFAIDHGAGDVTAKFFISYLLTPKKAGS